MSAAVLAYIDEARYEGVPVLLISGKKLDERVGYARVLFKNDIFCVQNQQAVHCKPKQIVFHLGHGSLRYPAILVSRSLFKPVLKDSGWTEVKEQAGVSVLGLPLSDYHVLTPAEQRDAYSQLISHIFAGRRHHFVRAESLLASWALWTPLLGSLADTFPRIYPGGAENGASLDVCVNGNELGYHTQVTIINHEPAGGAAGGGFQVMQGKFRRADMVSAWAEELVERLAQDMQEAAEAADRKSVV